MDAAAFTANRARHQHTIAAEVTGEVPTAAVLDETNRYAAVGSFRESLAGWDYCLDAPQILPAGSVLNVAPREIAGMEWEGALVSRNISRG